MADRPLPNANRSLAFFHSLADRKWWAGSPSQEIVMVPALKISALLFTATLFLAFRSTLTEAQSVPRANLKFAARSDVATSALDDTAEALLAHGKPGLVVQQVRSEVLALLSETNSCSDWFLSAEPEAKEKFRSLHFEIDRAGPGEILKVDEPQSQTGYYHPYIARTRQAVGPGSTITLNANGAFFKAGALVRDPARPAERNSYVTFKALSVGNYTGGTPEARLLTVLHEFGHIVDLLPVDADVPSAPFVSVKNTQLVLQHCDSQIHTHAKRLRQRPSLDKLLPPNLPSGVPLQASNP